VGRSVPRSVTRRCRLSWGKKSALRFASLAGLNGCRHIINHYGLDLTNPDAQGFLMDNMKSFFYGESDLATIDTSKEGSIKW